MAVFPGHFNVDVEPSQITCSFPGSSGPKMSNENSDPDCYNPAPSESFNVYIIRI